MNMTILIAEDNAANRELLREILEGWGFGVLEAGDGEEVLAILRTARPALVLMDVEMPRLDGFAALQRVRSDPALVHLPVIAVTAYAMANDKERILAAGFDGYVSKPINRQLLRNQMDVAALKSCGDGDPDHRTLDQRAQSC